MELRHLRYFVAVAEEQHFGRAAERLHVTQSTLSVQVQALEREVGGPLFVRTSRRVELTEAGGVLLAEGRLALSQADRALAAVRGSVHGETGEVRVGFSSIAMLEGVLAVDLRRFHEARPDVGVRLTELPPATLAKGVREGSLDLGYSPDLGLGDASDLTLTHRARATLSVAVPHGHRLADASSVTAADLAEEELIVFAADHGDETVLDRLTSSAERRGRVRLVAGVLGALALASARMGVAVVPTAAGRLAVPDLLLVPLDQAVGGLNVLVLSRPDDTSGPVRAFLRGLRVPGAEEGGGPDGSSTRPVRRPVPRPDADGHA